MHFHFHFSGHYLMSCENGSGSMMTKKRHRTIASMCRRGHLMRNLPSDKVQREAKMNLCKDEYLITEEE